MSNSQNILVRSLLCLIAALAPAMGGAQNANGAQPVAYASVSELNGILEQLKQTTQSMQSDLPETIAQLNNSPEDLGASFKLYRNLVVLYDYFGQVVEAAEALGSKDESQNLANDLTGLETARRVLGERMQKLSASKEDELARLRVLVKKLSAAPPPPPQKTVVDDTEPPKKPAKKKSTKPKPPATTAPPNAPQPQ